MSSRSLPVIVGRSRAIRDLMTRIERAARVRLPVLIQGETGTGKELVARSLHVSSGCRGALVAANTCALPESLFEGTLFGHVRGAFTGASHDLPGYLAEANGGTLFLDEIGGLAMAQQAKLLRVLDSGEYRPVGGRRDLHSAFRLLAATNEPLEDLVAAGQFRSDLRYRLEGLVLVVPPLRHRLEDVPDLVEHFARGTAGSERVRFSEPAVSYLQQYDWPGNVREFRHAIERAIALAHCPVINKETLREVLEPPRHSVRRRPLIEDEQNRALLAALESCESDTARAAGMLGVARSTIYRRLQRLGVRPRDALTILAGEGLLQKTDLSVGESWIRANSSRSPENSCKTVPARSRQRHSHP